MSVKGRKGVATVKNVPVTKEVIRTWVKKDIETLYSLAYEMLSTPGVLDILADKLYERHLVEQQKEQEKIDQALMQDANL